jgi:hypothetical protein
VLDEGTRPAGHEDDWDSVGSRSSNMDAMDVETIDCDLQIRKAIDLGLELAPVELIAPVREQRAQELHGHPRLPARVRFRCDVAGS